MIAADVVEVDVDPIRGGMTQQLSDRSGAVVERRVETKVGEEVGNLGVRAGAPDHTVPERLGDLGGKPADGPGGRRDPDDVPVAQLRGLE